MASGLHFNPYLRLLQIWHYYAFYSESPPCLQTQEEPNPLAPRIFLEGRQNFITHFRWEARVITLFFGSVGWADSGICEFTFPKQPFCLFVYSFIHLIIQQIFLEHARYRVLATHHPCPQGAKI